MSGLRIGTFVRSHVKSFNLLSRPPFSDKFQRVRNFSLTNSRNMKFVQFVYNNDSSSVRAGYLVDGGVVDINKHDSTIPVKMVDILNEQSFSKVEKLKTKNPTAEPTSSVTITAPITGVDKILCIGLNYADHCKEQNLTPPAVPMIFSKFSSAIVGPNQTVKLRTNVTKKVDWEVELVVVIGKKCSEVKSSEAFNYVFGYSIAQDLSARDWQKELNGGQFLLGKSQDGFCPLGPCIVTTDEIPDPQNLNIKCSVNGVEKQNSNTSNLIHKIPDVIERLSSIMTLLPGDIILTGTPGGVGMHRKPTPEYLKPGDVVRSEVQNIGHFDVNFA